MTRKFFGMLFLMLFVLSVVGCGSSSTGSEDDECTKDPNAPGCEIKTDDGANDVLTDGVEP